MSHEKALSVKQRALVPGAGFAPGTGLAQWKWLFHKETFPLSACSLYDYWSVSVERNSQADSPISLFIPLAASVPHLCEEMDVSLAPLPQKCMCLLVCPRVWPHTSVANSQITGLLPRLHRLQTAQLRAAEHQLTGCGLCVAGVISSAWWLRSEVDKIWIPYWSSHKTCRKSTSAVLTCTKMTFLYKLILFASASCNRSCII